MARFATAAIVASGPIGPCRRPPIIARMSDSDRALLGGQTASRFLRQHWQKRARLVRSAVPGFSGMFDRASLVALAMRDDVESRLVVNERGRYTLAHGPFRRADFKRLPARGWTLLVQGLNLHSDEADALLRRFAFVPFARLDDLMVSYAVPGRRRRPALRQLRRVPAAGLRPAPLALRPAARPVAASRICR